MEEAGGRNSDWKVPEVALCLTWCNSRVKLSLETDQGMSSERRLGLG